MPHPTLGRHLARIGSGIVLGCAALLLVGAAQSQVEHPPIVAPVASAPPAPPAGAAPTRPGRATEPSEGAPTPPGARASGSEGESGDDSGTPPPSGGSPPDGSPPGDRGVARRCIADHTQAQEERLNGHLLEAGALFERCAAAACPDVVRADCEEWGSEVQAELPRVKIELPAGTASGAVQLFVDDQSITPTFDTPMVFDPGTITVRVEAPGGRVFKEELTLVAGEPTRLVRVRFSEPAAVAPLPAAPPTPPPPGPPPDVKIPTLSYVFGGVALGAFGVATGFAAAGLSDHSAAERRCAPLCSPQTSREVYDELIVADVALSMGVASAATAVILYLVERRDHRDPRPNVALGFGPGGGVVTLAGGF